MQTFVPNGPNLQLGFQNLDYRRLGKQRVEAWQILNILRGVDNEGNPKVHKGWRNHPATKMWDGFPHGLAIYGAICCEEWIKRGYNDTLLPRFTDVADKYAENRSWAELTHVIWPRWLWDPAVAETHRSNLIRKAPEHYAELWPDTADDLAYVWPTNPWRRADGRQFRCTPVPGLLTRVHRDDMMRISNEGNALTMTKGAMMARKKAEVIDDLELEELEELDEVQEEAEASDSNMLTAKAAATILGTDGRTLRKFLRKKYGVLGQGKRWEVDPDNIDDIKAEFASFNAGSRKKDDEGDDKPKPKGKVVKAKSEPIGGTDDELYGSEDDFDIIEDLADMEDPDEDDLDDEDIIEDLDDLEEL